MTDVSSNFKDLVDCPCGREVCTAFGRLARTGHVVGCALGCPVCDSSRRRVAPSKQVPAGTRRQLKARARGLCEAGVSADCTGMGVHAHHVRMRSQGGTDTLSNLKWVCRADHDWIHANPAEAYTLGLLERTEAE